MEYHYLTIKKHWFNKNLKNLFFLKLSFSFSVPKNKKTKKFSATITLFLITNRTRRSRRNEVVAKKSDDSQLEKYFKQSHYNQLEKNINVKYDYFDCYLFAKFCFVASYTRLCNLINN